MASRHELRPSLSADHTRKDSLVNASSGVPEVTYPTDSGITWHKGHSYTITWSGFPGDHVKIVLYKGSSVSMTIASSADNDGSYSWTVPSSQATGTNYRIKITSTSDSSKSDYSNNYFTIEP